MVTDFSYFFRQKLITIFIIIISVFNLTQSIFLPHSSQHFGFVQQPRPFRDRYVVWKSITITEYSKLEIIQRKFAYL